MLTKMLLILCVISDRNKTNMFIYESLNCCTVRGDILTKLINIIL